MYNDLFAELQQKKKNMAIVGLGYVGMPLAVTFANKGLNVIGFDTNQSKIDLYKAGIDPTKEVGDEAIKNTTVKFSANENELKKSGMLYWRL